MPNAVIEATFKTLMVTGDLALSEPSSVHLLIHVGNYQINISIQACPGFDQPGLSLGPGFKFWAGLKFAS